MPRGRWAEEDDEQADRLAASAKDRAENLMIVDLLRNDLGKVSVTGSVQTTILFAVERYRNVLQMTSTVESVCKPGLGLTDILRALFPCGSITGAPKVRTMKIIRELEPFPRHVYTGAIGLARPGGDCVFNVAIRTLALDRQTGVATFGVGGGITYDSTPEGEYDECVLKASFLNKRWPEFQLLETLLLEEGQFFLLERHIQRIKGSARYFNYPWHEEEVRSGLEQARLTHANGRWKVRLLIAATGSSHTEITELKPESEKVVRVTFAPQPIDLHDPFIYHKTTRRKMYEESLQARPGYDDVILWNERGEVTESSIANIVLTVGREKYTPPQQSGLLRGTFRDELIASGELRERIIYRDDLLRARSFFLINSVRRWMPAVLVE